MNPIPSYQGIYDDQIKIKIYIHYTAIVPINGFPLKQEILSLWKEMYPATT